MERSSYTWRKHEKPEPEKTKPPVTFYSQLGKKRLQTIWTAQDLDQENVFSSWIEYGPSLALSQEKVSDYIQSYLLLKNKTILALHHIFNAQVQAVESYEEFFQRFGWFQKAPTQYYFQIIAGASQKVYDSIMEERMADRRKVELIRTKNLIIERHLSPPPNFKHPVLNINILLGKLAALQEVGKKTRKHMKFGELPKIRQFDGSKLFKKKDKQNIMKAIEPDNQSPNKVASIEYDYHSLDLKTPQDEGSVDLCDFSDSVFEF